MWLTHNYKSTYVPVGFGEVENWGNKIPTHVGMYIVIFVRRLGINTWTKIMEK